jgi:hypothetical protein
MVKERLATALFAKSQLMTDKAACAAVRSIWQSFLSSADGGIQEPPNIVLIGQSLVGDIAWLRRAGRDSENLVLPFLDDASLRVTHVFDTYYFAHDSRLPFITRSLAGIASGLGVDPHYLDSRGAITGWHNASNDAAYTMLAALLFASRDASEPLKPVVVPERRQRDPALRTWRLDKFRNRIKRQLDALRRAFGQLLPAGQALNVSSLQGSQTRELGEVSKLSRSERAELNELRKASREARRRSKESNRRQLARIGLVFSSLIVTAVGLEHGYPAIAEALAAFWN